MELYEKLEWVAKGIELGHSYFLIAKTDDIISLGEQVTHVASDMGKKPLLLKYSDLTDSNPPISIFELQESKKEWVIVVLLDQPFSGAGYVFLKHLGDHSKIKSCKGLTLPSDIFLPLSNPSIKCAVIVATSRVLSECPKDDLRSIFTYYATV